LVLTRLAGSEGDAADEAASYAAGAAGAAGGSGTATLYGLELGHAEHLYYGLDPGAPPLPRPPPLPPETASTAAASASSGALGDSEQLYGLDLAPGPDVNVTGPVGPPRFLPGYPRVERVGALTFVVAIKMDLPGAVDLVALQADDYPGWGTGDPPPPSLAALRAAAAHGGIIPNPADPETPAPFLRKVVQMKAAGKEVRVLVKVWTDG
jgi:hypothetical protein